MKKLMALLLALVMVMSLAACGKQKTNENTATPLPAMPPPPPRSPTLWKPAPPVRKWRQANGFKTVAVGSQANALMEVGCRHR